MPNGRLFPELALIDFLAGVYRWKFAPHILAGSQGQCSDELSLADLGAPCRQRCAPREEEEQRDDRGAKE